MAILDTDKVIVLEWYDKSAVEIILGNIRIPDDTWKRFVEFVNQNRTEWSKRNSRTATEMWEQFVQEHRRNFIPE